MTKQKNLESHHHHTLVCFIKSPPGRYRNRSCAKFNFNTFTDLFIHPVIHDLLSALAFSVQEHLQNFAALNPLAFSNTSALRTHEIKEIGCLTSHYGSHLVLIDGKISFSQILDGPSLIRVKFNDT